MTPLIPLALVLMGCGLSELAGYNLDLGASDGEVTAIAITRWTDGHELFVELDPPVIGQRFAYRAHITRLSDHHAVASGVLSLRFEEDGFAVESHTNPELARAGLFAAEAPAPAQPGSYRLLVSYIDGDERSDWDAGVVKVGAEVPVRHEAEDEGQIQLSKENQWQIPFAVSPATWVDLTPTIQASAVVSPAPGQSTLVAAPVGGLFAWSDGLPVVGRRVERGERVGTLVPVGAAESWSRLQADLATARVDLDLAETDLARVEPLRARDLLPERRLQEAKAGVQRARAELSANQRRVSALTSERSGAMAIRAPVEGVIVAVGSAHGERVEAGAPLMTVAAGVGVMLEGRVHDRQQTELADVSSIAVYRGDWDAPRELAGAQVLTEQLVFDAHQLSAPLIVLANDPNGLALGDLVQLEVGVGEATPRLAVPRSAVVEINGQDVVFIQKTGESFARRRVALGVTDPTYVEILAGVARGERVVVEGGFDVHVASLSSALESHRH